MKGAYGLKRTVQNTTMKPTKKAAEMTTAELAAYIDQSVLKPEFTQEDIAKYIQEGIDFGCATVCINPASLPIARKLCKGTKTGLCVVCDFPFGLSSTASKVMQAEEICKDGDIQDLDIVANYGWIRSGMLAEVEQDIRAVAEVCHKHGTLLKVIFETDALTMDQIKLATKAAVAAGADFVKTSTGFSTGGATAEDVRLMREAVGGALGVKASGGVRTYEDAVKMIQAGATRIGASAGVKIVQEAEGAVPTAASVGGGY